MQNNHVLVYLEESSKRLFEINFNVENRNSDVPIGYRYIGHNILQTKTILGESGLDFLKKKFAIGCYTPFWISKNQSDDVRQKIEIFNHPVHKEPVVLSSYVQGKDISLTGRTPLEKSGFERIEFDGTIHDAYQQYNFEKKGKIAPEKDKNLIIILDEDNLKVVKEHGFSLEAFY